MRSPSVLFATALLWACSADPGDATDGAGASGSGGAGPGAGGAANTGAGGGAGVGGAFVFDPSGFDLQDLDHHRNRLLDTLAQRLGAVDRCSLWTAMTTVEKGLFLTHTDMLGHRSCMDNASVPADQMNGGTCDGSECTCDAGDACSCAAGSVQAIDHVFKLWAVNGNDLSCCTGTDCCNGGVEWHRTYFSADDALIGTLRDIHSGLPEWADSNDFFGPHDPFTQSGETQHDAPRGQVHFWANDGDSVALTRNGVEGVVDAAVVEMDNDYNFVHDSNPEGTYSSQYGRALYKESWNGLADGLPTTFLGNGAPANISEIAGDAIFTPACGPTIDAGGVVPSAGGTSSDLQLGAAITISGAGFATSGNRVFVRTRAMAVALDASSPAWSSESPTSIELVIPPDVGSGEGFVYVGSNGVLSNSQPVTLGP